MCSTPRLPNSRRRSSGGSPVHPHTDPRAPATELAGIAHAQHVAIALDGPGALAAIVHRAQDVGAVALAGKLEARERVAPRRAGRDAQLLRHARGVGRAVAVAQRAVRGARVREAALVRVARDGGFRDRRRDGCVVVEAQPRAAAAGLRAVAGAAHGAARRGAQGCGGDGRR